MNSEKSTSDFVFRQVIRMAGLDGFPQVKEAANELVTALLTAPSEPAAEQFVSEWIRANVRAPRPAEIYATFDPPGAIPEIRAATGYRCEVCSDSGFEVIERNGLSGARPCKCRTLTTVQ
jgi:hypothetical protein